MIKKPEQLTDPKEIEDYKDYFARRYPTKDDFYYSKKWQTVRQAILKRDGYKCQRCKGFGIDKPAQQVHHIEHLEDNVLRAFDPTNLMSVCRSCHNALHPEKAEHATIKGRLGFYEWKRKHPRGTTL